MPTADELRPGNFARPATVTCTVDGRDHLISEHATAAGRLAGHGEYVAICGRIVVAAPLVLPPGPTCWDCETVLHRVTTSGIPSHRRRGLLARLVRRCVPRTDSRFNTAGSHPAARR